MKQHTRIRRVLFFLVTALVLFAFLVLLLSLTLCVILCAGLIAGRRRLTVAPKRCILIFHFVHHIPRRRQTGAMRIPAAGLSGELPLSMYMIGRNMRNIQDEIDFFIIICYNFIMG